MRWWTNKENGGKGYEIVGISKVSNKITPLLYIFISHLTQHTLIMANWSRRDGWEGYERLQSLDACLDQERDIAKQVDYEAERTQWVKVL